VPVSPKQESQETAFLLIDDIFNRLKMIKLEREIDEITVNYDNDVRILAMTCTPVAAENLFVTIMEYASED